MNILSTLANWVATGAMALGLIAQPTPTVIEFDTLPPITPVHVVGDPEEEPSLAAALPKQDALIDTYLASGIDDDDTSMTLADGESRDGETLTGRYCFTVDVGTPSLEYICGTASGTAVTSLERGVKVSNPNATSSDLAFSHRRFAPVQVTDFPFNQLVQRQLSGTDAIEGVLSYEAGITPTGSNHLTDVEYVLGAISGTSTVSFDRNIVTGNAGETVSAGNLIYFKASDQEWYRVDTDTPSAFRDRQVGIAQGSGTNGNAITGGILLQGMDTNQSGLTAGSTYFASASVGGISTTRSTLLVGEAKTTTSLYFNPRLEDSYLSIPTGTIQAYASSSAPNGWLNADGSAVSRTTYAALFAVIGTSWGSGDGSTTFNVPNMKGSTPIGYGQRTETFTFAADTAVDPSTDIITVSSNDYLHTGQAVALTGSSLPTGLSATTYYIIRESATTIRLATSVANANEGTDVDITGDGSSTATLTLTLTSRTLAGEGGSENDSITDLEMPSHTHTVRRAGSLSSSNSAFAEASLVTDANTVNTFSTPAINGAGSDSATNNMQPYVVVNYIIKY